MLVVNCREPKTLNDTQYLHLHLIRSETADTRPQHVALTCGLKNTVKGSFLQVETSRVWCRGEVWRCLMDIPSCLGYHTVPSSSSSALTPPASHTAPERCWGACWMLSLNEAESEIQMLMSELTGNSSYSSAPVSKCCSQLWPGESSKSSGNLHSVVLSWFCLVDLKINL